jgi:Xaa-Pro aminopeptidase
VSRATSPAERERRRDALRALMEEHGYDALVVSGRGDEFVRGRIQYAADIFQWAGWGFLLLPKAGDAMFVGDPLWGLAQPEGGPPWVEDLRVSQEPGEEIARALADLGLRRPSVGIVGLADITASAHLRELERAAPAASLADATAAFDDVRCRKSEEEIANLYETSAILRRVFRALEAELRPGVTERDVLAQAQRLCRQFGCVDGIALIGRPPQAGFGWGTDAPLGRDDVVVVDLEWGGPSGYWLELRRCFSFGPPPDDVRRFWELRIETFDACLDVMRAGNSSEEILVARDRVYERVGRTAGGSRRYTAHGIGIDSLEPPWVPGKERTLREGMVVSLHPDIHLDERDTARFGAVSVGDNVLVTAAGPKRMTYDEETWIVLEP